MDRETLENPPREEASAFGAKSAQGLGGARGTRLPTGAAHPRPSPPFRGPARPPRPSRRFRPPEFLRGGELYLLKARFLLSSRRFRLWGMVCFLENWLVDGAERIEPKEFDKKLPILRS